jgi:glycosyltransferase involved in cell wall biosynthesis
MEKIRVAHHTNQLGLGGTEKTMMLFCKYLDKSVFDVYTLTNKYPVSRRKLVLNALYAFLGSRKALSLKGQFGMLNCRIPEFKRSFGGNTLHCYSGSGFQKILKNLAPHLLHVHHAGAAEPPLSRPKAIASIPVVITTNVFGQRSFSPAQDKIDKILFVSYWLMEHATSWSKDDKRCEVLYNPVEKPLTGENMRAELGIPRDRFVIGRCGRNADDIHDPISLNAYKEIENEGTMFLSLSSPPKMIKQARDLQIKNIRFLEPSTDDLFLSKFYNTLDVFAHARNDGETFGCVIAEAMMHGKPVVTHRSVMRNAQTELVDPSCGFIADRDDYPAYAAFLRRLLDNTQLRMQMGTAAGRKALLNFEAAMITKKLESIYVRELLRKGIRIKD